jgi:D-lactate dehydrogenase
MQKNTKLNAVFYGIWPDLSEYLRSKMKGISCHIHEEQINAQNIDKKADILAVFVDSPITKETITAMPNLKMIAVMSTGYDNVDIETAKSRRIPVCNVPYYGENTVAEHAMALMLGLTRKIFQSVKKVKEAHFDYRGLCGIDLKGKTLGVIGTGHIGQHLIRMAGGFEMNILGYDPYPNNEMAKKLGFKYATLDELLSASDFISLHVPLFKETYHLLNKENIKKIKKRAYVINTARGGLIDPEALLEALQSGHIAGAGLDVLEEENFVQDEDRVLASKLPADKIKTNLMNNLLIDHDNTIITPHNAFNSVEALHRIIDTTVENIRSFLDGNTINDVTAPKPKK